MLKSATVLPLLKALTVPIARIDRWLSRGWRAVFGETTGVVIPVFHAILPSTRTPDVDPSYALSIEQLAQVLDYFARRDFAAISLSQLQQGLAPGRNYVMFTFDDGYANNLAALDLLAKAGLPALVSVNTANIQSGDSFWWDVLYRELMAQGASFETLARERDRMIEMEPAAIRNELTRRFGSTAFRARGEQDRPMTPAELRELAGTPLITIGNHTHDHELLAGRAPEWLRASCELSQQKISELSGVTPTAIAYPYGRYDDATIAGSRDFDFQVGLTGEFGKLRLTADTPDRAQLLRLPRCVIYGDRPIDDQCENTHIDWKPSWMIRRLLKGRPQPARSAAP